MAWPKPATEKPAQESPRAGATNTNIISDILLSLEAPSRGLPLRAQNCRALSISAASRYRSSREPGELMKAGRRSEAYSGYHRSGTAVLYALPTLRGGAAMSPIWSVPLTVELSATNRSMIVKATRSKMLNLPRCAPPSSTECHRTSCQEPRPDQTRVHNYNNGL